MVRLIALFSVHSLSVSGGNGLLRPGRSTVAMQCLHCQHKNRQEAKFCETCGSQLGGECPSCGNLPRPGASFCDRCGKPLAAQSVPVETLEAQEQSQNRSPDPTRAEAERRHLTVLFCDLVGSTSLSERLDPEEFREIIQMYQKLCAEIIARYKGYIAQYLGDGVLVYFGYPMAYEDSALRAIRSALEIVEQLSQLSLRLQSHVQGPHALPQLQVRIGIHTGLAVVERMGRGGKRQDLALGDTLNIAARLQGIAEPGAIIMSASTRRLVEGLVEYQDLGLRALKGISAPVSIYQVLREGQAQSRFEVALTAGLTPLVGRLEEVAFLRQRWEQSQTGAGQVVLLRSEAGIGKSRLVQELKEQAGREGAARIEFRCSPFYQNTALYPVIDLLQRVLHFRREDSGVEKISKLRQMAEAAALAAEETVPLLAALLSLPPPDDFPALALTPQRQKQKTEEALAALLFAEAERRAVLMVWEDLHWADASTLELLGLLLDRAPSARVLGLLTSRPEFHPPWDTAASISHLTLTRLDRAQVKTMIAQILGGKSLPAEVEEQIISKTDGVPLFVEELTKMVVEAGFLHEEGSQYALTGPLPPLAIPATLHDSLMARLDRLAAVKDIAQLGATLGREFGYELIQAVSPWDEATLQIALVQLVDAELLYQKGQPPHSHYIFKHALIQDAAYQSLLRSKRQYYHQHIAQVLEQQFAEIQEIQPELLAHHYTQAALVQSAVPYWQRAGQRAIQRSADREAIGHLEKGLSLLRTLQATPERRQYEIKLQITLGASLMATRGYAAPEVEHAYARAWELCQQTGDTPHLFPVLMGLLGYYFVRAEHAKAYQLGEQLLTLAQHMHSPVRQLDAHYTLEATLVFLGRFRAARQHFEQGLTVYDPQHHQLHAMRVGQDPAVSCLIFGAWALWFLGYPDQALQRSEEGVRLARELSHSFSLAYALSFSAMLYQFNGDIQHTQERAEELTALCAEQGFSYWLASGTILQGWVLAERGAAESESTGMNGINAMRRGLAAYQATGAEMLRPYFLALLAGTYGKRDQAETGLSIVDEALTLVHTHEERFYEAELYRLKGELLFNAERSRRQAEQKKKSTPSEARDSDSSHRFLEAEKCFRRALDTARDQSAKAWELRAATSLSRLWQSQGRRAEAVELLAPIPGWFPADYNTPDLEAALALLVELS